MAQIAFPRMARVRQEFPVTPPVDPRAVLPLELARFQSRLQPGARVAVAVGSRGIANLATIVAVVVESLKARGAQPFIVPAMGSHGGATPEGQKEILAGYGVTEERLQVPIHAAMEVDSLGVTPDGLEVFFSREALRADGIVVINRIKPHTDFESDSLGSGLLKMLVVGLGKQVGAAQFHAASARMGHEPIIRSSVREILRRAPVLCGVAVVENQTHQTAQLAVLPPDAFEDGEAKLFVEARRMMPRLPFDEIDLLIVDRIGKNISGTGLDPAIIGRNLHGYSDSLKAESMLRPVVRRLFVRELDPGSHGNGIGLGLADFTTGRAARAFDAPKTYMNALTSLSLSLAKLPIHLETDQEVMSQALATLALPDTRSARVVRIADTLSLDYLEVSEALAAQVDQNARLKRLGPWDVMAFGFDGNFSAMSCSD